MSALVVLKHGKEVWVGSDGLQVANDRRIGTSCKWMLVEDCALGIAGSLCFLEAAHYQIKMLLSCRPVPWELRHRLIALWEKEGLVKTIGTPPQWYDCVGLYVRGGNAWFLDLDLTATEVADHMAIGSGAEYALGALHALAASDPASRMWVALDAACKYDIYCGPPLWIFNRQPPIEEWMPYARTE